MEGNVDSSLFTTGSGVGLDDGPAGVSLTRVLGRGTLAPPSSLDFFGLPTLSLMTVDFGATFSTVYPSGNFSIRLWYRS